MYYHVSKQLTYTVLVYMIHARVHVHILSSIYFTKYYSNKAQSIVVYEIKCTNIPYTCTFIYKMKIIFSIHNSIQDKWESHKSSLRYLTKATSRCVFKYVA